MGPSFTTRRARSGANCAVASDATVEPIEHQCGHPDREHGRTAMPAREGRPDSGYRGLESQASIRRIEAEDDPAGRNGVAPMLPTRTRSPMRRREMRGTKSVRPVNTGKGSEKLFPARSQRMGRGHFRSRKQPDVRMIRGRNDPGNS